MKLRGFLIKNIIMLFKISDSSLSQKLIYLFKSYEIEFKQ